LNSRLSYADGDVTVGPQTTAHESAPTLSQTADWILQLLTSNEESIILIDMSKRLQVLLEEAEFAEIRRAARLSRMTVAEWVRQALRRARREEPVTDTKRKLSIVREAARGSYPTADIDQMLAEIERGYTADAS
jgi:hypothetical protein